MKNYLKLIFLTLAVVGSQQATYGEAEEKEDDTILDLPTYEFVEVISLPKPRRSPIPKVKRELVGTSINLRFVVNEKGDPENIRLEKPLTSYTDVERMTFASQTLDAVSKWRFEPALDSNDNPVAVKVLMPVKVVKFGVTYKATATVAFDDGSQKNER